MILLPLEMRGSPTPPTTYPTAAQGQFLPFEHRIEFENPVLKQCPADRTTRGTPE